MGPASTPGAGTPATWRLPGRVPLVLGARAQLMGIINVTPDSFSDGGQALHADAAACLADRLLAGGALCLDLGAASSRPGAVNVPAATEWQRLAPVLAHLASAHPQVALSIDTSHGAVAERALALGASLINDIRAGADPRLVDAVASHRCPLILMHMQGEPESMQAAPCYGDVVEEVLAFLERRLAAVCSRGVAEDAILLDPGIGFGKTRAHNAALLRALPRLTEALGRPLVVGVSRKSLLRDPDEDPPGALDTAERDRRSHILHALLAERCQLLRVHDAAGARQALRLGGLLVEPGAPPLPAPALLPARPAPRPGAGAGGGAGGGHG